MKFELVDPAEGPGKRGSKAFPDDGAEWTGDPERDEAGDGDGTADAAESEEAEKTPEGRLKASTRQLTSQVKADAAGIGDMLAEFAQQVADRESPVTGSGHRPTSAPSSFRAERFSADQPGAAGGPAAASQPAPAEPPAASAAPPASGQGRGSRDSAIRTTMEPGAPRVRPTNDDRR